MCLNFCLSYANDSLKSKEMVQKGSIIESPFWLTTKYLERRYSIEIRMRIVREFLDNMQISRIIDLGCGDGSISLQFLPKSRLTLVDRSEKMLERCRSKIPSKFKKSVELVRSSIEEYRTSEESDVVLCLGVLSHIRNVRVLINKIGEILKGGGTCLIQATDWDSILGKIMWTSVNLHDLIKPQYGYKLTRIGKKEIIEIGNSENLSFISERRYCSPLPLMNGLFSDRALVLFQEWAMRQKWISPISSDTIMMFRKNIVAV